MKIEFNRQEMAVDFVSPMPPWKDCWISFLELSDKRLCVNIRAPRDGIILTEQEGRALLAALKAMYE